RPRPGFRGLTPLVVSPRSRIPARHGLSRSVVPRHEATALPTGTPLQASLSPFSRRGALLQGGGHPTRHRPRTRNSSTFSCPKVWQQGLGARPLPVPQLGRRTALPINGSRFRPLLVPRGVAADTH